MVNQFLSPVSHSQNPRPLCLHVFPSFGIGGVPLGMVRIIAALGSEFRHDVIALDGVTDAKFAIPESICCSVGAFALKDQNLLSRLLLIKDKLRQLKASLLVTYNWGAIEWAMANQLFVGLPHVHHEAGFGKEEAERQLQRRVQFRRWALRSTRRIVVPSRTLERMAVDVWRLPKRRVMYVPNGIDDARFADARTRHIATDRAVTIGSSAPLRPEKNVSRLLHAFAIAHERVPLRLILAGDGADRPRLEALARELNVAQSVHFLGAVERLELVLSELDIFALSSDTEQMPYSILEAMACALPVASPDVGDVRTMLAPENAEFVVARNDSAALGRALIALAGQPELRQKIGQANLKRVQQEYSQSTMVDRWRFVFNDALSG